MSPTLSIITPSFNAVDTIERTIMSVLEQTYPFVEYIIIDGGSTDGTQSVIKKYAPKLAYWCTEPDNGQADAIKKGMERATGEIVAWLNADDEYLPLIFDMVAGAFQKYDTASLIYGNCYSISPQGQAIANIPPKSISKEALVHKGNTIFQPAAFYRRSALQAIGYLDEKYTYWMEYDLNIKLVMHGTGVYLPYFFANFYQSDAQKSNRKNWKAMDREAIEISRKYGGSYLSPIYIRYLFQYLKSFV